MYLLQFACCIITAMLAMMVACSRFQMRWLNHRYEVSRWLVCLSMSMLSVHYVLQMSHGIRAKDDDVGAVVNILFYTPIVFLISYATYNVVCTKSIGRRFFIWVSVVSYLLILSVFVIGTSITGSINVGSLLYVMLGLFILCMAYCIFVNVKAMRRHRKYMEEDTAADMLPYDRYTASSYLMMAVSALMLTVAIMCRPLLYVIGPLMLVSLFVFTLSFIGYGYNIMPSDIMLEDTETEEGRPEEVCETLDDKQRERMTVIADQLHRWCEAGGFRDTNANIMSISLKIGVSKDDLSCYFERCLATTFRVWLSDIRFKEAQRMLVDHPEYSNDTISSECGFSSHAHLYKIFKTKTGMTPDQWKRSL